MTHIMAHKSIKIESVKTKIAYSIYRDGRLIPFKVIAFSMYSLASLLLSVLEATLKLSFWTLIVVFWIVTPYCLLHGLFSILREPQVSVLGIANSCSIVFCSSNFCLPRSLWKTNVTDTHI
jgi:hypothetical protein